MNDYEQIAIKLSEFYEDWMRSGLYSVREYAGHHNIDTNLATGLLHAGKHLNHCKSPVIKNEIL